MQQSDTRSIDPPWRLVRLGPRDGDRYCDHLMRLDATDRRFRFFEEPPDHLIALHAGFAASDGRTLHACESEGEIRGVGELLADRERPGYGELAFSVERDWRRSGLGLALMQAMIDAAKAEGLAHLELEILPDNLAMQGLARRFATRTERRNGNIIAVIEVASDPEQSSKPLN